MRVEFDAERGWWLSWETTALHLRIRDAQVLADYFGPLSRAGDAALPGPETLDPLSISRADCSVQLGSQKRLVHWSLEGWSGPDESGLTLSLRATDVPLRASLEYRTDPKSGVLHKCTVLTHTGEGPALEITHAASMSVLLSADVREVVHLAGRWGAEAQVQRLALPKSALLLESRSGKTGFQFAPYAALLAPDFTYFTQLLWSGNWELYLRRQSEGRVLLSGGLNEWGLRHRLVGGQSLMLPDALLGCVPGDLNEATQRLHAYRRRHRPDPSRPIPVQFNSWYPYQGNPPAGRMKTYAEAAASLGCEVFVLDAGWYTNETEAADEGWWLRTGDWMVNRALFPHGLEELSDFCREKGIAFGIWMEPEAIGPSARVRREHPEWLHAIGGRVTPAAERGILNLGVPEARAWARDIILDTLRATGASWFKWDFNADLLQGGWAPGLPEALTRQDPVVAHYEGLYALQDEIRAALPGLTLEMCSSGGGRLDGAVLSHAHADWISDQTHAIMKLAIHFGSQLANPPEQCNDWLVEWPPQEAQPDALRAVGGERPDLQFRLHVAMLGSFGLSAPLERWSDEDFAVVKQHVGIYKRDVRPVIQGGRQYFLTDAPPLDGDGDWAAVWYVLPDQTGGVLFAFRLEHADATRKFALPGLNPASRYEASSPDGWRATATGRDLQAGLEVEVQGPFCSRLVVVKMLPRSETDSGEASDR